MIYIIVILVIYILAIIAISESYKIDALKQENKVLRDRTEETKKWYEFEMKMRVELARNDERYKINAELFSKECEEFTRQCEEYKKIIKEKGEKNE